MKKLNIKYQKKNVTLKRKEKKTVPTKTKCSLLFRKFLDRVFFLDEEPCFTFPHSTFNDNGSYFTSDVSTTYLTIKYTIKAIFGDKILV